MKLVRLSKIINQYYITWKSIMLQWMNLSPRQPKKQLWPPGILDSSSGKLLLANLPIGQLIFKLSMLIKNIVDFSTQGAFGCRKTISGKFIFSGNANFRKRKLFSAVWLSRKSFSGKSFPVFGWSKHFTEIVLRKINSSV